MTTERADAPRQVVVIGGGLTGLSAAHRLLDAAREGRLSVTVLEASSRLGGVVRTAHADGLVIEEGPDSFLVRKPWAVELCRTLGLEDRLVATPPQSRRSFVYHAGKLHRLPAGVHTGVPARIAPFVRSRLLSPGGKVRALLDLVLPRTLPSGGDVALGRLLRARFGREVVERLAEPLLSGIYAGGVDDLSLDATFPDLRRQEAQYRSLIRAAMVESRRAREAAPGRAPDRPDAPPPPVFQSLRGGLETLIERLGDRLRGAPGVSVRPNAAVHGLERASRGGYTLRLDDEELHADAVLVAAPAPQAARLLAAVAPPAARELHAIAYADVALVALAYDRAEVGHGLAGSGFVVPRGEDIAITACTWVSAKWPESAPPDTVLLRAYLGRAGERVLDLDDDALEKTARAAVGRSMAITAAPRLVRVIRVPQALPQYAVGHPSRVERIEAAIAHLPGLWVTGSAFRGIGMPDCVRQGSAAAEAALAWAGSAAAPPATSSP